jgi:hypothetical protein
MQGETRATQPTLRGRYSGGKDRERLSAGQAIELKSRSQKRAGPAFAGAAPSASRRGRRCGAGCEIVPRRAAARFAARSGASQGARAIDKSVFVTRSPAAWRAQSSAAAP